jgi:ABC-type phosphate transport system ATPase subunit
MIVTHNRQRASSGTDYTSFVHIGLVDYRGIVINFESLKEQLTEQYITGKFG